MPGIFIDVKVDASVASDTELAQKLTEVCPVSIFSQKDDGSLQIEEENLDECTLCDLCMQAFPGQVEVKKLYEE